MRRRCSPFLLEPTRRANSSYGIRLADTLRNRYVPRERCVFGQTYTHTHDHWNTFDENIDLQWIRIVLYRAVLTRDNSMRTRSESHRHHSGLVCTSLIPLSQRAHVRHRRPFHVRVSAFSFWIRSKNRGEWQFVTPMARHCRSLRVDECCFVRHRHTQHARTQRRNPIQIRIHQTLFSSLAGCEMWCGQTWFFCLCVRATLPHTHTVYGCTRIQRCARRLCRCVRERMSVDVRVPMPNTCMQCARHYMHTTTK